MEDYWILKLDANGNKVWDKTIGGNGADRLYKIRQTLDGGFILAGNSRSGISGDKTQPLKSANDFWLVKVDANGSKIWDKSFGGITTQLFRSLEVTSDGGFILGGQSGSDIGNDKSENSRGGNDYWVVRTDSFGNKLWDKTFGGAVYEDLLSIKQTSDGGYILGGYSNSNISGDKSEASKGGHDYWMVRLNSSGNKIWDKTFGGSGPDQLFSVQETVDGGFLLGGQSLSGIGGDKSENFIAGDGFWILKTNSFGTKIWDKSYSGNNSQTFNFSQQTTDGGFVLGGFSLSGIGGDKSEVCRGAHDYWIIKTGPEVLGTKEAELNAAISVFPNPSLGKFHLHLQNLRATGVEITILDLLGQVVLEKEIKVSQNEVSNELEIKASKGIYVLQLKAGNQITSRKIVVE